MNDSLIYSVNTSRGEDGLDSYNEALGCLRGKKGYVYFTFWSTEKKDEVMLPEKQKSIRAWEQPKNISGFILSAIPFWHFLNYLNICLSVSFEIQHVPRKQYWKQTDFSKMTRILKAHSDGCTCVKNVVQDLVKNSGRLDFCLSYMAPAMWSLSQAISD